MEEDNIMKHYHVNVNGTDYEIEIEEISAEEAKAHQASAPAAAAASAPAAVPTGAETVSAPMPGTILDVKASVGQSVNKGDVLMILEAMKMENEIMAPKSGKVVSVNVSKGASVKTGDVLLAVE